jgi:hypothetical protein
MVSLIYLGFWSSNRRRNNIHFFFLPKLELFTVYWVFIVTREWGCSWNPLIFYPRNYWVGRSRNTEQPIARKIDRHHDVSRHSFQLPYAYICILALVRYLTGYRQWSDTWSSWWVAVFSIIILVHYDTICRRPGPRKILPQSLLFNKKA